MTAFDFGDGEIRYFAACSASSRNDDQLFLFDKRYLTVERLRDILESLQYEKLRDVDHRSSANGNDTCIAQVRHIIQHAVHHFVRRFSQAVLLLHDKAAGKGARFHVRLIQKLVGNNKVILAESKCLRKITE